MSITQPIRKSVKLSLLYAICMLWLFPATAQETFTNPSYISIPDGYPPPIPGAPYPSIINVSDLKGVVTSITVTLYGYRHNNPDAVDLLLVAPDGTNATILSDVGGATDIHGINIILDDAATAYLPDSKTFGSGTYKPTNMGWGADKWPPDAPAPSGYSTLSAFLGINPNGNWKLYAVSDTDGAFGSIDDGWSITINTIVINQPFQVKDFKATYNEEQKAVLLSWSTLVEVNTESFVIERATTGSDWTPIGKKEAARFSLLPKEYEFTDANPVQGHNMYRLKLVSKDGSVRYSHVVIYNFKGSATYNVYPNPARSFTYIHSQNAQPETVTVQILDINHNPVMQTKGVVSKSAPLRLDVSSLQQGNYFVLINTANTLTVEKIKVVQ